MKYVLKIIFFLMFIYIFNSCFICKKYNNWQTVYIPNVGEFRVPQEWIVTHEGGIIYITDKSIDEEYNIYLIGKVESILNSTEDTHDLIKYLTHDSDIITANNLSNSSRYGQREYILDGKNEIKFFIEFYNKYTYNNLFILNENLLDTRIIKKISSSYIMEH